MSNERGSFQRIRNDGGFSLLPVLVVSTAVAVAFLQANSSIFGSYKTTQEQNRRSYCEDMVQSSLNNFRSLGMASNIYEVKTGTTEIDGAISLPSGLSSSGHWSATGNKTVVDLSSGIPEISNYKMLEGGMSALNTILNSNSAYCTSQSGRRYSAGGNPLLVENPVPGFVESPETFLRVQLVDLRTGDLSCPSTLPFYVRPAPATPLNASSPYRAPANTIDQKGFRVTVTTRYVDPKNPGSPQSCSATADFAYPSFVDDKINATVVSVNIETPRQCQPENSRLKGVVTVRPPADVRMRGQVLLCKDLSSVSGPAQNCPDGARRSSFTSVPDIVPCEEMKLCGQTAVSKNWSGSELQLSYENLPWGCQAEAELTAIDLALNKNTVDIAGTGRARLPACASAAGCPCGGYDNCPSAFCFPCPPPPPPEPPVETVTETDEAGNKTNRPMTTAEMKEKYCSAGDSVCNMYVEELGRPPDAGGAEYWNERLEKGASISELRNEVRGLTEYQCNHGSGDCSENTAKQEAIERAKYEIAQRGGDPSSITNYAQAQQVNNSSGMNQSCGYGSSSDCGNDYADKNGHIR